jgi:hypothetical protein
MTARRTRGLARAAAVAAALAAVHRPTALAAQRVVTGVVVDSLRGRPLTGAAVQLVPRPGSRTADLARTREVVTDSAGAFRIDAAIPGEYLLGFVHEHLDRLGIEPPARELSLTGGATALRADLAIPGPRTLAAALCGAAPGDSAGVLLGRVVAADTLATPPSAAPSPCGGST